MSLILKSGMQKLLLSVHLCFVIAPLKTYFFYTEFFDLYNHFPLLDLVLKWSIQAKLQMILKLPLWGECIFHVIKTYFMKQIHFPYVLGEYIFNLGIILNGS